MENQMIIVGASVIIVILILVYFFVIKKDDNEVETGGSSDGDLLGAVISSMSSESFSNIKRKEHFTYVTPGVTGGVVTTPVTQSTQYDASTVSAGHIGRCSERGIMNDGSDGYCRYRNACPGSFYHEINPDVCTDLNTIRYFSDTPEATNPPIYINGLKLNTSLNYIPACENRIGTLIPSNLPETFNNYMNLEDFRTLTLENKLRYYKSLIKHMFIAAAPVMQSICDQIPYVNLYNCNNELSCECNGFEQYPFTFNSSNTSDEEETLRFLSLMFGYIEELSEVENLYRINANILHFFTVIMNSYSDLFCSNKVSDFENYVLQFEQAGMDNKPELPGVDSVKLTTIGLVFMMFYISANLGVLVDYGNQIAMPYIISFEDKGASKNLVERFKIRVNVDPNNDQYNSGADMTQTRSYNLEDFKNRYGNNNEPNEFSELDFIPTLLYFINVALPQNFGIPTNCSS
jgi:hypothetical protein